MNLGKVGIIFNGGGFCGAYSVGFVKALAAQGIKPEFVQGVSVGALTASKLIGTGWNIEALEQKWLEVQQLGPQAIFNRNWRGLLRNVRHSSLFVNDALSKYLISDLDAEAILNSPIEFQMVTFNERRRRHQIFSNHDPGFKKDPKLFRQVALASIALQGFLPPVMVNGEWHSDGVTFRLGDAVSAKCDTIFILSNNRLGHGGQEDTGNMRWYRRFLLVNQFSSDLLEIRDIKHTMQRGYDLVENNPSSAFDSVKVLSKKAGRRIKKGIGDLTDAVAGGALEQMFIKHRVVLLTPPNPIPTFYVIDFRQPNPKNSYPGDITLAIQQCFNHLGEEFWKKF